MISEMKIRVNLSMDHIEALRLLSQLKSLDSAKIKEDLPLGVLFQSILDSGVSDV